jgi:hypothetical protein
MQEQDWIADPLVDEVDCPGAAVEPPGLERKESPVWRERCGTWLNGAAPSEVGRARRPYDAETP